MRELRDRLVLLCSNQSKTKLDALLEFAYEFLPKGSQFPRCQVTLKLAYEIQWSAS